MKLPRPTANQSTAAGHHRGAPPRPAGSPAAGGVTPAVTIRQDLLTQRGWNCAAGGGGHGGYACFSAAGYPHWSIVNAARAFVAGATPATSYYTLTFNRFHYSPNAATSYWYREYAPGRWEPEAQHIPDAVDSTASWMITNLMGGSLYGFGASALDGPGAIHA